MEIRQTKKTTHWSSGVLALDTTSVSRHLAMIVKTEYNEHGPFLGINLKREGDVRQGFVFYTTPLDVSDSDENPLNDGKIPESMRSLYEDLGVRDYRGLVGMTVRGVYFGDKLVGIEKA